MIVGMTQFGPQSDNPPSLLPLPPHPANLAWSGEAWPAGDLDPRVDRAALEGLLDHAFSQPDPDDMDRTHSLVIIQGGRLVAERHAHDSTPDDTFLSWSMAKSITNALVGILVHQGKLDIDEPVDVPEWPRDDKRRRITVDQMLRMVDGLRFREAEDIGGGSVRYYSAEESDVIPMLFGEGKQDVAKFAASLPYVAEPEARWNYNSGASNLLARMVSNRVGGGEQGMRDFMRRELFDRIGMKTADPRFDERGNFIGSSHCYCSGRDFARFGYLFLRDGVWEGERILPEGWVDYTRTPTPQAPGGCYGAHFWVIPGSLGLFECNGMGGQRILISPKLDLVMVRVGKTEPHKIAAVVQYLKSVVDLFRPTAA
jgi:CubicO group peptidase (beta-lactamase class C family)